MSDNSSQSPSQDPPQKIIEYQKLIEEFQKEKANYKRLWKVFTNNVLAEDFKYSKWAALSVIFVPTFINIYFIYRPDAIFKNSIRLASVIACLVNFRHQLNQDMNALLKKDTVLANQARGYVQNLASIDPSVPDFGKETIDIYSTRIFF